MAGNGRRRKRRKLGIRSRQQWVMSRRVHLAGLAAAGLGITFLTASDFAPEVAAGRLRVINTQPAFPPIQYFAVHRTGEISPLGAIVASIARDCCDSSVRRFS